MTALEKTKEYINRLIQHQGYFIIGNDELFPLGSIHCYNESQFGKEIPFVITAMSNDEEAKGDTAFLGLTSKSIYPYWYRAIID